MNPELWAHRSTICPVTARFGGAPRSQHMRIKYMFFVQRTLNVLSDRHRQVGEVAIRKVGAARPAADRIAVMCLYLPGYAPARRGRAVGSLGEQGAVQPAGAAGAARRAVADFFV